MESANDPDGGGPDDAAADDADGAIDDATPGNGEGGQP